MRIDGCMFICSRRMRHIRTNDLASAATFLSTVDHSLRLFRDPSVKPDASSQHLNLRLTASKAFPYSIPFYAA